MAEKIANDEGFNPQEWAEDALSVTYAVLLFSKGGGGVEMQTERRVDRETAEEIIW